MRLLQGRVEPATLGSAAALDVAQELTQAWLRPGQRRRVLSRGYPAGASEDLTQILDFRHQVQDTL